MTKFEKQACRIGKNGATVALIRIALKLAHVDSQESLSLWASFRSEFKGVTQDRVTQLMFSLAILQLQYVGYIRNSKADSFEKCILKRCIYGTT